MRSLHLSSVQRKSDRNRRPRLQSVFHVSLSTLEYCSFNLVVGRKILLDIMSD
jgi:hypothetical protein